MPPIATPVPAVPSAPGLLAGLRAALRSDGRWPAASLVPLPDKGLAHLHVRLAGTGLLARVPKQSQLGLAPLANLRHQAACFERAWPGGHTPRLAGILAVAPELPRGALLVEEIDGATAVLPRDLGAIAGALAALHALPVPPPQGRAPLADAADPLRALAEEIGAQALHLPQAGLEAGARRAIEAELQGLERLVRATARPARHLVAFDAHPGNFLLRSPGDAVLVDLEKCRYSHPGLDLAHATLYTSTTWDVAAAAALSPDQVANCYAAWEKSVPAALAAAARPWHLPLRHAMWLWSLTWCCKWRALSGRPAAPADEGEDWSAARSDAPLVAHVRERVAHYLSPAAIALVQRELQLLAGMLPA